MSTLSFGLFEVLAVLAASGLFLVTPVWVAWHASRTPALTRLDVVRRTALVNAFVSGVFAIVPSIWLGLGTLAVAVAAGALQGAVVGAAIAVIVLLVRARSGWFAERP